VSSSEARIHNLQAFYSDPALLLARQAPSGPGATPDDFAEWVLGLMAGYAGLDILDAGAGVGRFTGKLTRLAELPHSVVALDLFTSMLDAIRTRARPIPRLALINGDIGQLPFVDGAFDLVFANHVLYHLEDISCGLDQILRVLRPAGRFVATTNADVADIPVMRLHEEVVRRTGIDPQIEASRFSLENGAGILRAKFSSVMPHVFTGVSHHATTRALLDAYGTTGRCRLLSDVLGQDRVLGVASTVVSEWFGQRPEGVFGEIRMAAFVCTNAAGPAVRRSRFQDRGCGG
jgi:SAM-dependent methyltransferase